MEETFSIVSRRDEHLLVVYSKEQLHRNGGYHRSVHVLIEVFGGLFVLQKKSKGTENEGRWSSAVSGHVRYGESYEGAAIREMEEELGIKAELRDLNKLAKIGPSNNTGNEFVTIFTYLLDPKNEKLKLNEKEVNEIVKSKLPDVIEDIEANMDEYSPAFIEVFNTFLSLEKGMEGVIDGR
jgi:isopentenyldiphosphate isomerase